MAFVVTDTPRRELYPEIEPFASGWMTADGHEIYYEECGNPNGLPAMGAVAPIGGLLMIVGWLCLAFAALRS